MVLFGSALDFGGGLGVDCSFGGECGYREVDAPTVRPCFLRNDHNVIGYVIMNRQRFIVMMR